MNFYKFKSSVILLIILYLVQTNEEKQAIMRTMKSLSNKLNFS